MARSSSVNRCCSRGHASDKDDSPARWSNRAYALHGPAYLGSAMVFPTCVATVVVNRACYCPIDE
jgi:hypothetical protein